MSSIISDAEWQIMKVIWLESHLSANEIIEKLNHDSWSPKTIKTMLNRLVGKKVLGYEQKGKAYLYFAILEQKDCIQSESQSFLSKVFGGSLMPMISHFVEDERLSDEDIKELQKLLKKKK